MPLPYLVLDVFTDTPLTGNQLAVVLDAGGVTDETMQLFARETKLSETTFVQTATEPGADYLNRIFTVAQEVPFAGHPSLGTAVAVAIGRGDRDVTYVQQTLSGLQEVTARRQDGGWHASVRQNEASFGEQLDPVAVMAAVGLDGSDAHPGLPAQMVTTGLDTLIVPIADAGALARAKPDFAAIDRLLDPIGAHNYYLALIEGTTARTRMFTRLVDEGEDPATGSAAGPLMAYAAQRLGVERLEITQGVEMGRPSRLSASLEDGRVRVGGGVVVVVEGTVTCV